MPSYFNNSFTDCRPKLTTTKCVLNLPPYLKPASALPSKMNKNVLANVAGMISYIKMYI